MSTPFSHTTRAIASDSIRALVVATSLGFLILIAWLIWFFTKDITIYSVSDDARLEQEQNTIHVSTQRIGRVITVDAELGDTLEAGDTLVQLDTSVLDLSLKGDTKVSESLKDQLGSVQRERRLLDKKFGEDEKSLSDQLKLLEQRYQLQVSNQKIQAEVADRYERLLEKQQSSELDYLAAKRAYQQMAMATLKIQADIRALEDRRAQLISEYKLEVSSLTQRNQDIDGKLAEVDTRIQQSHLAVNEQKLRTPIAGKLAALAEIREGEVLAAGQQIATIQAEGLISVQAFFPPALALGHIQPGQKAQVKLDGFSWARYGQLEARVERVASAVQQGKVLVQLSLQGEAPPHLPLLHDLPARVEIATGKKTPYQLLLQRTGEILSAKAPAETVEEGA
ncbi:HlyD family secretion protein [Microbulbifer sp. EKSA005]|uniref:HlyD family secretion protein n=1 Tax=Microbulbifer sp. EKSA005 TaxID=3243364 RepID=UPI004042FEA7